MLEAQRDAIVADAQRDTVMLINQELSVMRDYFATIGTQAAFIGGFAVNLFSVDFFSGDTQDQVPDRLENFLNGSYFLCSSISAGLLLMCDPDGS